MKQDYEPLFGIELASGLTGGMVLRLSGDLDYSTAPRLRETIIGLLGRDPRPAQLVLDMAAVSMLDSTGLGTLVVGYRICDEVGVRLTVREPSPFVIRIMEI